MNSASGSLHGLDRWARRIFGRALRGAADSAAIVSASPGRLKSLAAGCRDIGSLRCAVSELCAEFGKVTRLDIFTMGEGEKRKALCFLQLEFQGQESDLMNSLGVGRFGDDVLVIVDLPADARQLDPIPTWAEAGPLPAVRSPFAR